MDKTRWQERLENFEKAYLALSQALTRIKESPDDDLLQAGFIQTYEFTLELAWKTLQDYLEDQGFREINSPKKVIRTAFAEGYIKEGELWLQALDDRNLTVHTYKKELAEKVAADITSKYFGIIRDLYLILKKESTNE